MQNEQAPHFGGGKADRQQDGWMAGWLHHWIDLNSRFLPLPPSWIQCWGCGVDYEPSTRLWDG